MEYDTVYSQLHPFYVRPAAAAAVAVTDWIIHDQQTTAIHYSNNNRWVYGFFFSSY